jgi:hypothetical protein
MMSLLHQLATTEEIMVMMMIVMNKLSEQTYCDS